MSAAAFRESFVDSVLARADTLAVLSRGLEEEGLAPLPPVACPAVFDADESARVERAVRAWHRAMAVALRVWAQAPEAFPVAVPGALRARVVADALSGVALGFTRYDFMFDRRTKALALLECQAGDPSGMGMEHGSARALERLPGLAGLFRRSPLESLRELIAPVPHAAGLVVFAIQREAFVNYDHQRVARGFREAGVDAVVADPDELRFERDGLWWKGRRVDVVVRDSLEDLLAPRYVEASRALLEAWAAGVVKVWNPVGSMVADHKVLLQVLRSSAVGEVVGAETAALLRETVPEQGLVEAGMIDRLIAARADWVIKPSDGFGGFDVTIGEFVSDEVWRAALHSAQASGRPFIAQQVARAAKERFPVVRDGALTATLHHVVYSGWMYGDRFGGMFARVHEKPVVNVHQGGGLVPVYTLPQNA